MKLKRLYVEGLEDHHDYRETVRHVKSLVNGTNNARETVTYVEGTEDWKETLAEAKDVVFPVAKRLAGSGWQMTKFVSKEGFGLASKAVNSASLQIKKLMENNKHFIKEVINGIPDEEEFEITFAQLNTITVDGTLGDFIHDINEYKVVVNALNKHSDDIVDYLTELTRLASRVSKGTNTKEAMQLLGLFDDMKYPTLNLKTHLLPGGRTVKATVSNDETKYSMLTDKPSATTETIQLSKNEVKAILNKLIELNESLLLIKKGQERFINTMKAWNERLPKVMTALVENTELGNSTKQELKAKFKFESSVLSFYGELYPELGACVNAYILALSGNLAKII